MICITLTMQDRTALATSNDEHTTEWMTRHRDFLEGVMRSAFELFAGKPSTLRSLETMAAYYRSRISDEMYGGRCQYEPVDIQVGSTKTPNLCTECHDIEELARAHGWGPEMSTVPIHYLAALLARKETK